MKNSIYLIFALLFLIGCNKDDSTDGNDDGGGSGSAVLVKNIKTNHPGGGGTSEELFHYQDNKLKAIEYPCYDIVRYFDYGSRNKVSEEFRFFYKNFDINTFNIQEVINDPYTIHSEYVYENNRLTSIISNDVLARTFSYNSYGQVKNMVISGYNPENYIITYENGFVSSVFVSEQNGYSYNLTFKLDNKKNPFYELFREYGIIGYDGCNSYYKYMFVAGFPLIEQNIIVRFVDNKPGDPATYTYNENGIPVVLAFDTYHGRVSHIFSY